MDTFRSHTWRKKISPWPARISNEVMWAEWPKRQSPRALQGRATYCQWATKPSEKFYGEMKPRTMNGLA
jgi:hypothetical protein